MRLRANCRVIAARRHLRVEVRKRPRQGWYARVGRRKGHRPKPGDPREPLQVWAATEMELLEAVRRALLKLWPRKVGAPRGNKNARGARARRALLEAEQQRQALEAGDDIAV